MTLIGRQRRTAELVQLERDRAARDRDAAEAERHRLRTALDALATGVVLADRDGVLQVRNAAAGGFAGHEAVLLKSAVDGCCATRRTVMPARAPSSSPARRAGCCCCTPSRWPTGFALATIDDVSERARLDAVRTDFVANISHELKTPVGALGAARRDAAPTSDEPEVVRRLADADGRRGPPRWRGPSTTCSSCRRIELGGEAPAGRRRRARSCSLDAIERIRRGGRPARHAIVLTARPTCTLKVLGDRRQLVSALANLIDNAVKYSRRRAPT